ncbi:MAG TPA: hypothetical protein DF774_08325 [Rheinheimera sp.]|uniref:hypothetical protein n=1 Tax=Rheinheimera sp. TaxID=1869214 RepID=UPI000ECE7F27|nr:hypothetical protein [Rheinheimera sp.]HCU65750.1 hypothetical protein [Rheinheimera sp.]
MERCEQLYQFWLQDRANNTLLADLLSVLSAAKEFELLSRVFEQLEPISQELPFVKLYKLQTLMMQRDLDRAGALIEIYRQEFIGNDSFTYLAAQNWFLQKNYTMVLSELGDKTLDSELYVQLAARCHYLQCSYQTALQIIENFTLSQPELSAATIGLYAAALADSGNSKNAWDAAQQALAIDPCQVDALLASAYLLIDQQRYTEATFYIQKGLEEAPSLGRFWSMLGQVKLVEGNLTAADDALERSVLLMPDHVGTWLLKGWSNWLQNRLSQAEADFKNALLLDRNFAESHAAIAAVLFKLDQRDAAELSLAKARRLNPSSITIVYVESLLAEADGQLELAQAKLDALLTQPHYSGNGTYKDVLTHVIHQQRQ